MTCSILFVEDDSEVLETMLTWFTRRGVDGVGVSHPDEAIVAVAKQEFLIAVLDRLLPESEERSLTTELRSLVGNLQVIILSGYAPEHEEKKATSEGAFAYLAKPCSLRTLEEVIESAMNDTGCRDATELEPCI